jgi:hypothetical protein
MSIVGGGTLGFLVGGVTGFSCPLFLKHFYPEASAVAGNKLSALPIATGLFGIIGGTICGVTGGKFSHKKIHDYGAVGGLVGGIAGGIIGGSFVIYINSLPTKPQTQQGTIVY